MRAQRNIKERIRDVRRRPGYARFEAALFGWLIWAALRSLRWLTRFEMRGFERVEENWRDGRPMVFAFWHGRAIMLPFLYRGRSVYIMNSLHRDGEMITRALARLGIGVTRGSSTRGAIGGMRGLLRALRDGSDVALIPDGPKGPAGEAKSGAVELAAVGRAPLFPVAFSASRSVRMKGWDRMMFPLPGARVICLAGEPLEAASGRQSREQREQMRCELEARLCEVTRAADRMVGRSEENT